jgi:hypothetical protein
MGETYSDVLSRSYAAVAQQLPEHWSLSLRCASTGLSAEGRSPDWLAVAEGPSGEQKVGRGADPERALADLHGQLQAP